MTNATGYLGFGAETLRWPGAELRWWPDAVAPGQADRWLDALRADIDWQEEQLTLFGRQVQAPRLIAWHGDAGRSYRYSGVTHHPSPWTPLLAEIRDSVQQLAGHAFNSVLLNYYRHGQDSMGWHADDEAELGPNPVIASLSLGQDRRMRFRRRRQHSDTRELLLTHGSLLVMSGQTQSHWHHAIPKTRRAPGPRINLTFRHITSGPSA